MPLSPAGLGAIIKTELIASVAPTNEAELTNFCNALGKAIVEYILANALVAGTVTSGQGAGGTVTGQVT